MMKANETHTPGPWRFEFETERGIFNQSFKVLATDAQGEEVVICRLPTGHSHGNARLISAAPELLDTCRALARELNAWHSWRGETVANYRESEGASYCAAIISKARAAIAKAERGQA